jgi:hypothetical protein
LAVYPDTVGAVESEPEYQEDPWYGTKRYEIVDKVYNDIVEKERTG